MSNQKTPFPSQMYPFMYPYPPPPFLNSFPSSEQKNHQYGMPGDFVPQPLYPMHPFGYQPYPMMYPPPPPPFYQFPEPKVPARQPILPNQQKSYRQSTSIKGQVKKRNNEKLEKSSKGQMQVIVVSDNQQKGDNKKRGRELIKNDEKASKQLQKDNIINQKLRKQIKRAELPLKIDRLPVKPPPRQRKKEIKHNQFKRYSNNDEDKELRINQSIPLETHYESYSRSTRTKFLTAKDGRGKILIGEEYQANLPEFLVRDESFSCWVDSKKNSLLCRTFI